MDSDGSDLTEIDYEEEENETKSGRTRSGKAGSATRKVRKVLSKPRTVHYTPQSLYEQIYNGDIDLNPDYQRDVVWGEAKQSALIDSLLRHYYVPPVILAVKAEEDGMEHRTCIDGKQRLTSIQKFIDGMIPFRDPFTHEKYWFKDDPNDRRARKMLPDKYRKEWARIQLVCIEYDGLLESEEREIFQRVQLGMALTPAEKLQAISSPKASFIRELLVTYSDLADGSSALNWDVSRAGDFRCFSFGVYNMEKYPKLKSGGTIAQVEKWLSTEEGFDEGTQTDIHRTYSVFLELAKDKQLSKCFRTPTTIAPVEFVAISVLIDRQKDRLSLSQLSRVIRDMRVEVRGEHKDIRLNSSVAKTMLAFIGNIKLSHVKGEGEPAGKMVRPLPKRKRKEEDESGAAKVQKGLEGNRVEAFGEGGETLGGHLPRPQVQPEETATHGISTPSAASHVSSPMPSGGTAVPDRLAAIRTARLGTNQGRQPPTAPAADRVVQAIKQSNRALSQHPSEASPSPSMIQHGTLDASIVARINPNHLPYQSPSGYQDQDRTGSYYQHPDHRGEYSQQSRDDRYGRSWSKQEDYGGRGYGR